MFEQITKPEVITLGCRLNQYESQIIKSHAEAAYLTNTSIVNTCAVTAEAVRQARQTIRRLSREKPNNKIIVTGCAAQINPEAFATMPEVTLVLGNEEKLKAETYNSIEEHDQTLVSNIMETREIVPNRIAGFGPRTRAYIQIQQGCDHRCTFCIIPFGRGNSRSIPLDFLVEQVKRLAKDGYKEFTLTGVDISSYGGDLTGKPTLGMMVRDLLNQVPCIRRLRLSSLDPAAIDDTLISVLAEDSRLMPHIHLSIQAGSNIILKRMKRRHQRDDVVELCDRLRLARAGIVFGADIIAGFPTETDEMFEETLQLVDEADLTYLHVFPYSARKETPAANMPQVPKGIRKERSKILREKALIAKIEYFRHLVGSKANVLSEENGRGYTEHYAPIQFQENFESGQIHQVNIIGLEDEVLIVELAT